MTGMGYFHCDKFRRHRSNRTRARGGNLHSHRSRSTATSSRSYRCERVWRSSRLAQRGSLSIDPLGFADGVNLFLYVSARPVNLVDPSGQQRGVGGRVLESMLQEAVRRAMHRFGTPTVERIGEECGWPRVRFLEERSFRNVCRVGAGCFVAYEVFVRLEPIRVLVESGASEQDIQRRLDQIVHHELIHAVDYCDARRGRDVPILDLCKWSACSEIRAYSRECYGDHPDDSERFRECVLNKAITSSQNNQACKEQFPDSYELYHELVKILDDLFPKCVLTKSTCDGFSALPEWPLPLLPLEPPKKKTPAPRMSGKPAPPEYMRGGWPTIGGSGGGYKYTNCFGAGTLVHTPDGTSPIEELKVGSRVLSMTAEGEVKPSVICRIDIHQEEGQELCESEDLPNLTVTRDHPAFNGREWGAICRQTILLTRDGLQPAAFASSHTARLTFNICTEIGTYLVGAPGVIVSGLTRQHDSQQMTNRASQEGT